jgi:hypothetical protein
LTALRRQLDEFRIHMSRTEEALDRLRRDVDWLTEQVRDQSVEVGERLTRTAADIERLGRLLSAEERRLPPAPDPGERGPM